MSERWDFVRLDGEKATLVVALEKGGAADLVYLGARLPGREDLSALAAAQGRGRHESQPDAPPVPGLLPEPKAGWMGSPAVALTAIEDGAPIALATDFRVTSWEAEETRLAIRSADPRLGLECVQTWTLSAGDVVRARTALSSTHQRPFWVDRLSALALPVPPRFTHVTTFSGRWAHEIQQTRRALGAEGLAQGSAHGKPGFGGNWLILDGPDTGEALSAHLAWSGDFDTRIECDRPGNSDGRAILQMAPRLTPGEIALAPGDTYETPEAVFTIAPDRKVLAHNWHRHVRAERLATGSPGAPRKVHVNSWDALGVNLSEPALIALAEAAAEVGAERFVLDDGWFAGRRSTATSLGDWFVSRDVFPNGLTPLIDQVHALGMDFGLWVEPEMVSPESDLYRAHPDWCLHSESDERPTMRGQLVLDLARPEVREAVFAQLDALLNEHAIAYLKWDHNRDLFPVGHRHAQTMGSYALIDRVRAAHPEVDIEGCAEGGGRIDYALLERCHRVWPSDNNDAAERVRIMQAWSQFLPLEVLGNHVGPSPNPITGRTLDMDFRAKVALFGHMGIEADPRAMSEAERKTLAAHIALYKDWRALLHSGDLWRLDHPDPHIFAQMVVGGPRALAIAAQTQFSPQFDAAPLRLAGLDPSASYRVTLPAPWPARASLYLDQPERWREGLTLSGEALMRQGLALPLTHPETTWLIALERCEP